jgi:5-formyltetrahydrofolate cyclo-ligase
VDTQKKIIYNYLLNKNTILRKNSFDILEPENAFPFKSEPDMVLVPLVIVDKKGNRIGYGQGYYDRYLASLKNSVLKIGLSLEEPVEEIIAEHFDVPVNYCVTPSEVYKF